MQMAPGSRLGAYEIVSPLGAGGMGEVYRARDTTLNREVAIKILPDLFAHDSDPSTGSGSPRATSRGERVARVAREAQVLASLNHPNIARPSTSAQGVPSSVEGRGALPLTDGHPCVRREAGGHSVFTCSVKKNYR